MIRNLWIGRNTTTVTRTLTCQCTHIGLFILMDGATTLQLAHPLDKVLTAGVRVYVALRMNIRMRRVRLVDLASAAEVRLLVLAVQGIAQAAIAQAVEAEAAEVVVAGDVVEAVPIERFRKLVAH